MKFIRVAVFLFVCFFANSDARCRRLLQKGVSSAERTTILNEHNNYRKRAANGQIPNQPKASNMKKMNWDGNLAAAAQRIAETCEFKHVKVNDRRFPVGQNLYWSASTVNNKTADWRAAIYGFYDEYKTYRFGTSTYNHYTQVVWANSNLVGCGFTYYENRSGWYEKLYVCNYGPAGNFIGQTPYKVGPGCENLC